MTSSRRGFTAIYRSAAALALLAGLACAPPLSEAERRIPGAYDPRADRREVPRGWAQPPACPPGTQLSRAEEPMPEPAVVLECRDAAGRLQGPSRRFTWDGYIVEKWFRDDVADGPQRLWLGRLDDAHLAEDGQFSGGLEVGTWRDWNEGRVYRERHFEGGKLSGPFREWYPDGTARFESTFRDGARDGREARYHRSGRLAQEEHWAAGKRHGRFAIWNEQGVLVEEAWYEDDTLHGRRLRWYDDGSPKSIDVYERGERVSREVFFEP